MVWSYRCGDLRAVSKDDITTLNTGRNRRYEGYPAVQTLEMALFEQSGLTDLIDSRFRIDPRKKLTPGNAVKGLIGAMSDGRGRRPLYMIDRDFMSAPVDLIFGDSVEHGCLNDRAFARNLDMLFSIDLGRLLYDCYLRLCSRYGSSSSRFAVDRTNFTITALGKEPDGPNAAMPERCGHAKDGHNERLVYSLLSVTDGNGIVCYERPYDGATADSEMDRGAIDFLSEVVVPKNTVLTADCKIATMPLVDRMSELGFGFITKCPESFGKKVKDDIVYSVRCGIMDPSSVRDGWEIYDTDAEVEGMKLRFVAYRTTESIDEGIEYLRIQGGKETEALFARFASKSYNCIPDALSDINDALVMNVDSAYDVTYEILTSETELPYGKRGRPPKNWVPDTKTEYTVDVRMEFNEGSAKQLSQDRGVRVLMTNLPRRNEDAENIRFGATADTVLLSYLGQYRIEHAFRLMKSGLGMSCVYLHRPSRENAMEFIIAMATLLSDVIGTVLKAAGIDQTAENIANELSSLNVKYDRSTGEEFLEGEELAVNEFMTYVKALNVDPDHLFR